MKAFGEKIKIDQIQDYPIEKRPTFEFESGAVYDGQWRGPMRHGIGTMEWADGASYHGKW